MNKQLLKNIFDWFENYAAEHMENCPEDRKFMLGLKLEHSRKVAMVSRCLAEEIGWEPTDINAAEALGILHDVGRFSQFAEYGTFNDSQSINHGERGWQITNDSGILEPADDIYRQAILDGILYHNRREIPPGLTKFSLKFVKLIRDADKLDIYRVISDTVKNDSLGKRLKAVMHLSPEGPVSDGAVDDILSRKTVSNENLSSLGDFYLMLLSWIYDINYRESVKWMHRSKIYEILEPLIPQSERASYAFATVSADMKTRLGE